MEKRLQKLETALSQMAVSKPQQSSAGSSRRRRNRRKRRVATNSGLALQTVGAGEVRISKIELCTTLQVAPRATETHGSFSLEATAPPFLKKLSASFERVKWLRCRVFYKTAASMMTPGLISIGCDWSWNNLAVTRKLIASYSPTVTSAVWKDCGFVIPPARLQSRLWYSVQADNSVDAGPCKLVFAADCNGGESGVTIGELWIDYEVVLSGTTA